MTATMLNALATALLCLTVAPAAVGAFSYRHMMRPVLPLAIPGCEIRGQDPNQEVDCSEGDRTQLPTKLSNLTKQL